MAAQYPFSDHPSPPVMPSAKDAGEGLSRPLSYGERKALETQAANRRTVGMTPGQHEEQNLRAIATDMEMKRPVFSAQHVSASGITQITRR